MPQLPHDHGTDEPDNPGIESANDFLAGLFPAKQDRLAEDPVMSETRPSAQVPEPSSATDPVILRRDQHEISRKNIDYDALKALYRLTDNGHIAYLVGGAVRDLMLGRKPKDFDIVTDATPRKVKRLFRNCRIIGRRFRLAHLHYSDGKIIEVATFRSSGGADEVIREGEMIRRDNVYGSPEEDAQRRDLTINGLFYDASSFCVIDFVGGVTDLRSGVIRMIGDACFSFREDPIRMLRAIRHSVRIGFQLDPETRNAMEKTREEILKANPARLLEELYKDLCSGHGREFFQTLYQEGFLQLLMPALVEVLQDEEIYSGWQEALGRLDEEIRAGHKVHQAMGIAALVSPFLVARFEKLVTKSPQDFRTISRGFREDLSVVLRQLKVYRRDEERLWAALGGLPAVAGCVTEQKWSAKLRAQPWLRDSMEILYVLLGGADGRRQMLVEARKLPVVVSEPRSRRRRRPPRRSGENGQEQRKEAVSEDITKDPEGADDRRRVRRRRRRKPARNSPEKRSGSA